MFHVSLRTNSDYIPKQNEFTVLYNRDIVCSPWSKNWILKHNLQFFDIWLVVHHRLLLLPTWYTNFLFIHTNYIKLNSSTCFERNPLIIRRSATQIVHMQPLVSSLSTSDRLVQPLRKDSFLSGCTRRSLAESDDTRGCICTICVVDLLMMGGMPSKHVEEFSLV
jgi:hypothetical protein